MFKKVIVMSLFGLFVVSCGVKETTQRTTAYEFGMFGEPDGPNVKYQIRYDNVDCQELKQTKDVYC